MAANTDFNMFRPTVIVPPVRTHRQHSHVAPTAARVTLDEKATFCVRFGRSIAEATQQFAFVSMYDENGDIHFVFNNHSGVPLKLEYGAGRTAGQIVASKTVRSKELVTRFLSPILKKNDGDYYVDIELKRCDVRTKELCVIYTAPINNDKLF